MNELDSKINNVNFLKTIEEDQITKKEEYFIN